MVEWLQKWFMDRCNGEWERDYTANITTINNPGWMVIIDLSFTVIEDLEIPYTLNEISEDDWIGYSIEKRRFVGAGDPAKLNEILAIFKGIWELNVKG